MCAAFNAVKGCVMALTLTAALVVFLCFNTVISVKKHSLFYRRRLGNYKFQIPSTISSLDSEIDEDLKVFQTLQQLN